MTQNSGLIFQDYPKPRFLLNLDLFFVIPAIAFAFRQVRLKEVEKILVKGLSLIIHRKL